MLVGGGHLLAIVNFKEYLACNLYSQHYSLGTAAPWPFAVSVQQHTHTHTQSFNGPFSRTTWVGQYQKGKTNLDLTEARDGE